MEEDSVVLTVNAAATAIVAAESRPQQIPPPGKCGGWLKSYWCFSPFATAKHGKRINPATVVPESTLPESASMAPQNLRYTSTLRRPFIAPPSSPASFLHSDSAVHSPTGLTSPGSLSSYTSTSCSPYSIYAIGPYAHEQQLVSPPVFSAVTTEPSTAPFTPPPEPVHYTTPSSPDVPFAQLLMSSLNSTLKKGRSYEFNSYQIYSGHRISRFVSRSAVCSGTSSPFYDQEKPIKFPEGLLFHKIMSLKREGLDSPNTENVSGRKVKSPDSNVVDENYRFAIELTAEDVARYLEKEPLGSLGYFTDAKDLIPESRHQSQTNAEYRIPGFFIDETYHDLPAKPQRPMPNRAAKGFKTDNADGKSEDN